MSGNGDVAARVARRTGIKKALKDLTEDELESIATFDDEIKSSTQLFNNLKKNNSVNSTYNGITFTVDMLNDDLDKVRLFALRSFGESLYHSITDASLEFGFKSL